jgi:molybdopterin/thiamine biosynthesis adenylyltransferase
MKQFTALNNDCVEPLCEPPRDVETIRVTGIPARHPAEPELFARHKDIPGHNQDILTAATIFLVGAGGLNSWVASALARSGAGCLIIADEDIVDRTNLSRQLYFRDDLDQRKGPRLARNVAVHAIGGATVIGLPLRFEEAIDQLAISADIFVVGVDNNACRLRCAQEAKRRGIPAVFTMLSRDGMRCQSFLQGASLKDPCLWCALPNMDPEHMSPCASAIISSCFLAASLSLTFVFRALMGWPDGVRVFNWREADLLDMTPHRTGYIARGEDCSVCNV